jgi:hypothetical protein
VVSSSGTRATIQIVPGPTLDALIRASEKKRKNTSDLTRKPFSKKAGTGKESTAFEDSLCSLASHI